MADGTMKRIDAIEVGDMVLSMQMPVLSSEETVLQWSWSKLGDYVFMRGSAVTEVFVGTEVNYCIVNDRIFVTPEHPFLVKRRNQYSFCSVNAMRKGDWMVKDDLTLEKVESIVLVETTVNTVNLTIGETQTFVAEGCVVHNMPPSQDTACPTKVTCVPHGHFWQFDWMHPRTVVYMFLAGF